MTEFKNQEMFPLGEDNTSYRLLTTSHVSTMEIDGRPVLKIEPEGLRLLAEQAFKDVSHL